MRASNHLNPVDTAAMEPRDRLNLYTKLHDFEHGQQAYLKSSATGVVTILALLTAGLFFYIRNLPVLGWRGAQVLFVALLVAASAAILLTVLFLARAWWGHTYGYVASPRRLENWFASLEKHAGEHGMRSAWVEEKFIAYLVSEVGKVTESNRRENTAVAEALHRGKGFMLAGLFCLTINLPVYYYCIYTFGRAQAPVSAKNVNASRSHE